MSTFSFSRLNKYLLTVLPHLLKDLQGDHFNYVKIAQHALVYFNQGNTSKLLPNRLMHSVKKQQAIYHLKRIKHNPKRPLPLKETVVFDSGRTFSNEKNQPISVYFHEFLKHDKRNQITHLIVPSGNKNAPHEIHLADFPHLASFPLDKKEAQILKEVKNVLIKLRENKHLPEGAFDQLSSAFHRFFEEFHYYFQLLKKQPTKRVVATNHYHQEGLIAACRVLGIRFIEIQHGLINSNDLYYVYDNAILPEVDLRNAFFPDDIILYGPFWKRVLQKGSEHRNTEMHVMGDYVFKQKTIEEYQVQKQNEIFIGAQKNMPDHYVNYAQKLLKTMEKHPDWKLIIKLHPLEKDTEAYFSMKHDQLEIHWNESDLMHLLSRSKIQISIYSTTFFDALGLNVKNLSLQNFTDYKDYAAEMVNLGVATSLGVDQDPIQLFHESSNHDEMQREDVYAPFDIEVLNKLLTL